MIKKVFIIFIFTLFINQSYANENLMILKLKHGDVLIELYKDIAPNHVKRFVQLAKEKKYDGVVFHRVIDGFMAQTGDPRGDGTGGSDKSDLPAEFNDISHTRGIVSMARANDPNSANSQFFICLDDSTFLDGQYTAWGEVISGMHAVDKIKLGEGGNGKVLGEPSRIISMKVAADAKTKK